MAWTDPTTLALLGASAGFLDPHGGMQGGFNGALQGLSAGNALKQQKVAQDEKQRQLLQQIEAQDFLKQHMGSNTKPRELAQSMIMSGNPVLMAQAKDVLSMQPKAKSFLKVQAPDGSMRYQAAMDSGEFGDVNELSSPEKLMQSDLGGQQVYVDPMTGQIKQGYNKSMAPGEQERLSLGYANLNQSAAHHNASMGMQQQRMNMDQQRMALDMNPDYQSMKAANVAGARQSAINQVNAQRDLPQTIDKANESIQLIDDIVNHPGFSISVGKSSPIGKMQSMIPGTAASDFSRRMEQIQGQQFLQAFETLKGGGQITEVEGTKASQAISRMNTAQSEGEFKTAAEEFKQIIKKGVDRAKQKAGVSTQSNVSADGWGELK